MTTLTDARILSTIFYREFDPLSSPFDRSSAAFQEAWLSVAAAATLIGSDPIPRASVIPGQLYLLRWDANTKWADIRAPARPHIGFFLDDKCMVIKQELNQPPTFITVLTPSTIHRIPGIIYPPGPYERF